MKSILILFACLLMIGCSNPQITPSPIIPNFSSNQVYVLIEESAKFSVYSLVHTNYALKSNFSNTITILEMNLNTSNYSTITFKKQIEIQEPIVYNNLLPTLELLAYNTNSYEGLLSLKRGILGGLE